jgi:transcriptional regulator with GAF, ATPase, and Fis domain
MGRLYSLASPNAYDYLLAGFESPHGGRRCIRMLFYGRLAIQSKEQIVAALRKHGLTSSPGDGEPSTGFAIVFFDTVDDGLIKRASELIGGETARILGVSTTSFSNTALLWALFDAIGLSDLIVWQGEGDSADNIAVRLERWDAIEHVVESNLVAKNLVGRDPVWKKLLRRVVEVAQYTDASTLLIGQSGTGKELVARLIHTLDRREPKQEMVITDCSTIVPELSGSEFFGHKKGAFTGAVRDRAGAFQIADGGTLFLDEVGELALNLQAQLLRVVQEGTYRRVGGDTWRKTKCRLICATNRDLGRDVEKHRFRADLYYRLASWVFHLPTLNDRPDDILPLTRHFLSELDGKFKTVEIDEPVCHHLLNRNYPGNVRELRQLVRRIGQRHVGAGPISIGDIPEDERPREQPHWENQHDTQFYNAVRRALAMGLDLKKINQYTKDTAIAIAVDQEKGNLQKAALKLGVTDRTLQMHRAAKRA